MFFFFFFFLDESHILKLGIYFKLYKYFANKPDSQTTALCAVSHLLAFQFQEDYSLLDMMILSAK